MLHYINVLLFEVRLPDIDGDDDELFLWYG